MAKKIKVYLDTEFLEDGVTTELISIGFQDDLPGRRQRTGEVSVRSERGLSGESGFSLNRCNVHRAGSCEHAPREFSSTGASPNAQRAPRQSKTQARCSAVSRRGRRSRDRSRSGCLVLVPSIC